MGERALVTGATGFLGAELCRELRDRGWTVGATRRERSDTSRLADLDVEWHVADVLDPDRVADAVAPYDRVFHLAGIGLADADPETVRRVNAEGTRNVLDACESQGVERVVFTSTAGLFRADGVADETDRAEPIGAYQRSKRAAERHVERYVDDGGDAVTVYPTSAFGPGDETFTARLLALATDPKLPAYLPGGASIVGVADVARGLVAAMERGESGERYLLGGENHSYAEILEIIADGTGARPPRVRVPASAVHAAGPVVGAVNERLGTRMFPFDAEMSRLATRELFYSSEKAKRELGYDYRPLESLVGPALDWFEEAR